MTKASIFSLKRILKAGTHSWHGLLVAVKSETAFRQELLMAAILLPIAVIADVSRVESILLILSVFLVLIVELINTAIEAAIDRISIDRHKLSAIAKDLGSAAVLLSLLAMIVVWGMIFFC